MSRTDRVRCVRADRQGRQTQYSKVWQIKLLFHHLQLTEAQRNRRQTLSLIYLLLECESVILCESVCVSLCTVDICWHWDLGQRSNWFREC